MKIHCRKCGINNDSNEIIDVNKKKKAKYTIAIYTCWHCGYAGCYQEITKKHEEILQDRKINE